LEQGVICSLKEAFGFIHCADRPEEIFFHYSELVGCRSDELNMDDEVEFRVQSRNEDKLAALQVRVLEKGSIVWETEDEPGLRRKGTVERPARSDARGFTANNTDGAIRIVVETNTEEKPTASSDPTILSDKAPVIRFRNSDFPLASDDKDKPTQDFRTATSSSAASSQRLAMGDIVEFSIVTDRRTKLKYARDITLLQSEWERTRKAREEERERARKAREEERERARKAREEELLASATSEQGVVTSLKTDYGFLRSNRRKEPVYFHYSNVLMAEEDFVLKEGQDVSFLVVVESTGDDGQKRRVSAREVDLLPRGSVIFSNTLAMGVTGVVTRCPHPVDAGHNDEVVGTILLSEPLHDKDDHGANILVSQVVISSKDSPGGDFSYRSGAAVGLWIREGDTLLFDVTKDVADGTYRASPTKHIEPLASLVEKEDEGSKQGEEPSLPPAVRLVNLSLVSRAEGVIHAIKDNYGFIHYAERIVDVHFRLYEVLPDELQADLRRSLGYSQSKKALRLEVGAEVQFDLSLHGKVSAATPARGGRNNNSNNNHNNKSQERENLKAQRLLLVPPGTVFHDKVLATSVKGVVINEDQKQPHAGTIEVEHEIQPMTMEERYPLVAKMIGTFLGNSQPSLVYPDLVSLKESDVITTMAATMGKGLLECIFIPYAGDLTHPGRLCIRKKDPASETLVEEVPADGGAKELTAEDDSCCNEKDLPVVDSDRAKVTPNKKKGQSKIQVVKTIRYDKHSLAEEFKERMPPCKGDIVVCDVLQSRKTGQVSLVNVIIVERKSGDVDTSEIIKKGGLGIVKEIAQSRQYGFISVFDETSTKHELLFFHMNDIKPGPDDDSGTRHTSASPRKQMILHRGDEVKFEYGKEKNGKKIAKNVEVVPKGTVPIKMEKNACRGYVLMIPSRTTIANSPLRHSGSSSSATGGSRWDNVKDDTNKSKTATSTAELGSILLLEDPGNVFATSGVINNDGKGDEGSPSESLADQPPDGAASEATDATIQSSGMESKPELISGLGSRVFYTHSAIAAHGQGSDGSPIPRRGDLVSFFKSKNGSGVRDVRVVKSASAMLVKGRLEEIMRPQQPSSVQHGTAKFIVSDATKEEVYEVHLNEVVSCNPSVLKEKEPVEGVLHDGKIYGICRISDIHLESKLGSSHKERPKLNLTVRKDRGGTIMAQSMMAKVNLFFNLESIHRHISRITHGFSSFHLQGPDGTDGFVSGWTQRTSLSTTKDFAELAGQSLTEDKDEGLEQS
jgi:cold shock CspA family protein